jgi:hypothetical protein
MPYNLGWREYLPASTLASLFIWFHSYSVCWIICNRSCQFLPEVSPKETDPAAKIPCWSCQELPCEIAQVLRSTNALLHTYLEMNCIMIITSSISLFVVYNVFSDTVPFCFFCKLLASSDPSQETYDRKISFFL